MITTIDYEKVSEEMWVKLCETCKNSGQLSSSQVDSCNVCNFGNFYEKEDFITTEEHNSIIEKYKNYMLEVMY